MISTSKEKTLKTKVKSENSLAAYLKRKTGLIVLFFSHLKFQLGSKEQARALSFSGALRHLFTFSARPRPCRSWRRRFDRRGVAPWRKLFSAACQWIETGVAVGSWRCESSRWLWQKNGSRYFLAVTKRESRRGMCRHHCIHFAWFVAIVGDQTVVWRLTPPTGFLFQKASLDRKT